MHNTILVHKMKIRLSRVMLNSMTLMVVSIGSIALVFAGHHGFRWLVYICLPMAAVYIMFCAALAMAGRIENDLKK